MARKKSTRKRNRNQRQKKSTAAKTVDARPKSAPKLEKDADLGIEADRLHEKAMNEATDSDLKDLAEMPQKTESSSPEEIIEKCRKAERLFEMQRNKAQQAEDEYNAKSAAYKKKLEELETEREAVKNQQAEIEETRLELAKEKKELQDRTETLDKRDVELKAETDKIEKQERELRKERQRVETEIELLAEDKEHFEKHVEQHAAYELEKKDREIKAINERLVAAREKGDELEQRLREREEADRRFGDRAPEDVDAEMRSLRDERDNLRKTLAERPSAESMQRLESLERQRDEWEKEKFTLIRSNAELKQNLAQKNIAVTEIESLRDYKKALEASNELLQKGLEEEIRKVENLVQGEDGHSPFPSCIRMDSDNDLQNLRMTRDEIRNLEEFTEYVRHRMARNPETGIDLYYSAADVRSFIGGLAMSRLHLIQGISGTGKTSLPLAFARAIGAGHALIEVQAGWRDRQDLIGHYNTFERRFHESEFLQALYRASCPQYVNRPFIVVLDEMNLSHPEQYFADLLSALEQEQQRQRLVLMSAAVEGAPALMVQGGRILPIPENVWFVGTANHDETTKDFADKTYDRAYVMELPRHRKKFEIKNFPPKQPIAMEAIGDEFDSAMTAHKKEADRVSSFFDTHLAEILGRRFGVGWGNRLQRQMQRYVPVVIGCGGSVGEAADHMLATKLLRKIRDRYDNRPEDIIAVRDQLFAEWPTLDKKVAPVKSDDLLREELHRLGHDED